MSEFKSYDDLRIKTIQSTEDPNKKLALACRLTQKQSFVNSEETLSSVAKLIKYLFEANHTSPFEHIYATFLIENVSRSFLAQITRHRMGSFTSASQHYQKYDSYPNILDPRMVDMEAVSYICNKADASYDYLISVGIPKEEARQVLPNAKAVNLLWTVNARSLINFFNQRMCKRNVNEMYYFAMKLRNICLVWWPELFSLVGPDCEVLGGCTQGQMKAKECIDGDVPNFSR